VNELIDVYHAMTRNAAQRRKCDNRVTMQPYSWPPASSNSAGLPVSIDMPKELRCDSCEGG